MALLGDEHSNSFMIQPRTANRFTQKAYEAANPKFLHLLYQIDGMLNQFINQMTHVHQIMIPFHRIPVMSEDMLILVALVLFLQNVVFQTPALPCHQIAASMNVLLTERFA